MSISRYGPHVLSPAMAARCHRAIFLDFDGVLHPPSAIAGARPPLEPNGIREGWPGTFKHLGIVAEMLRGRADIAVVVSSSWRMFLSDEQLGVLLELIHPWYGGSIGSPYEARSTAIQTWLARNPGITDFVVLDDKPEYFIDAAKAWPTLILCNSERGLCEARAQQALSEWAGR